MRVWFPIASVLTFLVSFCVFIKALIMADDEDTPKTIYTFLDPVPEEGQPASEEYLKTVPCKYVL